MPSDSHSRSQGSSSRCTSCGEPMTAEHSCKTPFQNLLGTTLDGRYQVKRILGQGGMGVVFQATQTSMNRDVAVKMLHPTMSITPQFAERFRREAEVVSRLKHPNIISIYDFGQTPDRAFYYTMELLEGENLKALVKRDGPMSVSRAVNLVDQIGEALAYAHSEKILHRDMKPHNVMCARFHGRDHVKVLDFGLVKMVDDEESGEEHLTTTGQILGTPAYMSPEQAGGDPLDARSDLYSLGVVLYYLLAGSTPFKASSANKLLQQAMTSEIPLVATRRQGAPIPGDLEMFLRRALAFDRDGRPADVEAFLQELHQSLEGADAAALDAVPTGAVAPKDEGRTLTGQRRTGSRISGTSSSRAASGSRAAGGSRAGGGSRAASAAQAPQGSSKKAAAVGAAVGLVLLLGGLGTYFAVFKHPAPAPIAPVAVHVAPPPKAPSAPKPSPNVEVQVATVPAGAQLYDGTSLLGTTPANLVLQRARGAVNLTIKLDGYLPQTQGIDLAGAKSGAPVAISLTLTPEPKRAEHPRAHAEPKKPHSDIPIFE